MNPCLWVSGELMNGERVVPGQMISLNPRFRVFSLLGFQFAYKYQAVANAL